MKIVLLGDSITDMRRNREEDFHFASYGCGYPNFIQGELGTRYPNQYQIYNRGVGGDRVVDLYARIKSDCWNLQPDLVSVYIGANDVWQGLCDNGVELPRFVRVYDMLLADTKAALPNAKFILVEPFVVHGKDTDKNFEWFTQIYDYAEEVKKLAQKYNAAFVPLQSEFSRLTEKYGVGTYTADGVHPNPAGAKIIADAWLKAFEGIIA